MQHLLEETGASSIIVSSRTAAVIKDGLSEGIDAINPKKPFAIAAPFETLLAASSAIRIFHHIASSRQFVREADQNALILHSSGTTGMWLYQLIEHSNSSQDCTGLPKAITLSHRYLLGYAACHLFPVNEDESERGVNLSTLPLFHVSQHVASIANVIDRCKGFGVLAPCLALSVGKAVCFPPSTTICNGSLVIQMLKNHDFTSLMTVPTILEDIVLMEASGSAAIELARLAFVVVGGGGIKSSVGSVLHSSGVTLLNHFGATELGALAPIFRPDKSYDWRYLRLRRDMGLELKKVKAEDGLGAGYTLTGYQFGSNSVFELQDSLEVNPLKPEAEVKILGRKDDLLVLATGEKVSPHGMENIMEREHLIKRAVLFGTGRFEVGMLIEPVSDVTGRELAFVDAVWPSFIKANETVDQHACISSKAAILIKPVDKEIPLSDKGSPQRKEVYSVFASEIQSIYDRLDKEGSNAAAVPIDRENPAQSIRAMVQVCLPQHNKPDVWSDDDDFVRLGMDSVGTYVHSGVSYERSPSQNCSMAALGATIF